MPVVHLRKEPYDVRIDRQTAWGNPFSHLDGTTANYKVTTREEAISAFLEWVLTDEGYRARWIRENVHELYGKTLGCWCAPKPCHGSVLLELARQAVEGV